MQSNLDYYNDFTIKVFEYLNGKVNKINSNVMLELRYDNFDKKLGSFIFPNIVCIYTGCIMDEFKEDNVIKVMILDTVIHELFHADQDINNRLYGIDEKYTNDIERSVFYMTAQYINHNWNALSILFGVTKPDFFNHRYSDNINYNYIDYRRTELYCHYLEILDCISNYTKRNEFGEMLINGENIAISINGEEVLIKANNKFIDNVVDLNRIVWEHAFRFSTYKVKIAHAEYQNNYYIGFKIYDQIINPIQFSDN